MRIFVHFVRTVWLLVLMFVSLCFVAPTYAGVTEGVDAFDKFQYALARKELEKPAEEGDSQARAYMGEMLLRGLGGGRDELKARNYIVAAQEKGNPRATYLLGSSYFTGGLFPKDEAKGIELIKAAANLHFPEAQAQLGVWIARGMHGFGKDEAVALQWFRVAADKKNPLALNWLAWFYDTGAGGLKQDYLQAIDLYKQSAMLGNVEATISAGIMYALGKGVTVDGNEALKWLRTAATRNVSASHNAYNWIASVYEFGRGGVFKNPGLAYAWYAAVPSNTNANVVKSSTEGKERLSKVLSATELADAEKLSKTVVVTNIATQFNTILAGIQGAAQQPRKGVFGTGFVVSAVGEVLTNEHVIANCPKIRVMPANLEARVISKDVKNDLALLKIDDLKNNTFPPVKLRGGRGIRLGDDVVVIGYPLPGVLSTGVVVTTGIVNAMSGLNNDTSAFQMSATVQPGSSGGPVFDRLGQLTGVVRARLTPNMPASPQNVNFAINLSTTIGFLDAYNVNYVLAPTNDKPLGIADLTATAQRSTVQIECY